MLAVMIVTKYYKSLAISVTFPVSACCFATPDSMLYSLILHPALSMNQLSSVSPASSYEQQRGIVPQGTAAHCYPHLKAAAGR